MLRVRTLVLLAIGALFLAGCEINTDYRLEIRADGSSEVTTEIVYDEEAAQLLGPPDQMLQDLLSDIDDDIEGARVISSDTDDSDPDAQMVQVVVELDDADALHRFVADTFQGSYTDRGDDIYELMLRPDADAAGDADMGFEFGIIQGSFVVVHAGDRVEMSGGEAVDDRTVEWDPFGREDLVLVTDMSSPAPIGAGGMFDGMGSIVSIAVAAIVGLLLLVVVIVVIVIIVRRRGASTDAGPAPAGAPPAAAPPGGAPPSPPAPPGSGGAPPAPPAPPASPPGGTPPPPA